ncbi:MAG: TolC family protein [Bacteroidetes bacterium]|nr:TolC family protein [Bacteroidota bacterium]
MNRKLILIITASLLFSYAEAQNRVWTFQQCLDTALQRNISMNQSRLNIELGKITLNLSKASRYPDVSASVRDNVGFGKSINQNTNEYIYETSNSASFGISSGMTIFNGFQISRTILQNKMDLDAVKTDLENIKNQVTLNITTAYLQVLFYYEILKTAKSQAEATAVQVDQTEKMVHAGKLPESNLFTIKSQQATDNLSVVNAQGQLDMARVTLEQLMEIPVEDGFEIQVPELAEPAILLEQTNKEIYSKALLVQPQIAGASIRTQSAMMGIRISESSRWPTINLSSGVNTNYSVYSGSRSSSNFIDDVWNNLGASIGLNLSIPIYSNRQIKSNIERAKVNARSAQLDEQNSKLQLRKTIEQSYTDLRNSIKKYEATQLQISAAELSYKNMERKYNVGMSTAIDYLIEKNNYFQAQSNVIQAKYDCVFKFKILDFYQGKPIQF